LLLVPLGPSLHDDNKFFLGIAAVKLSAAELQNGVGGVAVLWPCIDDELAISMVSGAAMVEGQRNFVVTRRSVPKAVLDRSATGILLPAADQLCLLAYRVSTSGALVGSRS
jgi:hypothetical protein